MHYMYYTVMNNLHVHLQLCVCVYTNPYTNQKKIHGFN